jgi:transcriptional regulator with XRE-family HTH domain
MPERSFGRTIRYRRTKLGLSQTKLGELVGRSASTIRAWERDKTQPVDPDVVITLAAVLGINERVLFDKIGVAPPEVETSPTVEEALAELAPHPEPSPVPEPEPSPVPEPSAVSEHPVPAAFAAPSEPYLLTVGVPPPAEPSYMEDRGQRQLYRVRYLATAVALVALVIALLWALDRGLEAFSEWWDAFFANLRL